MIRIHSILRFFSPFHTLSITSGSPLFPFKVSSKKSSSSWQKICNVEPFPPPLMPFQLLQFVHLYLQFSLLFVCPRNKNEKITTQTWTHSLLPLKIFPLPCQSFASVVVKEKHWRRETKSKHTTSAFQGFYITVYSPSPSLSFLANRSLEMRRKCSIDSPAFEPFFL